MRVKGRIILASSSPRRLQLLESAGLKPEVYPPKCIEETPGYDEGPSEFTARLALEKAMDASRRLSDHKNCWVIGADTTVVCSGKMLNKPKDGEEARHMLGMMSGKTHKVITSFCILSEERKHRFTESVESFVTFRVMSEREIAWYVASGEPLDKAGAYGAQGLGTVFIESIDGSYTNVVGLPLSQLFRALLKLEVIEF